MNGRRFAVIAIATLTLAAGSTASVAAAPTDYGTAIATGQTEMQSAVDAGASSVSAALVTRDTIVWTGSAGAIDAAGTKPATTTRYTIGSLSKLPTAIAIMQLVDKGLIDLDAPVITYLPELTMTSPESMRSGPAGATSSSTRRREAVHAPMAISSVKPRSSRACPV